jgi:clan AA aspartic protease
MELMSLKIEIGNPSDPDKTESLKFLIDSGAMYSIIPANILEKYGIKPLTEKEFTLADGSIISRKIGWAMFKYKEYIGVSDVIFGEKDDSTLLGALTLEALGLALDPFRRRLVDLEMVL